MPAMTVAVSIYAIGGMIGALAAGIVADWIGRSGESEREREREREREWSCD